MKDLNKKQLALDLAFAFIVSLFINTGSRVLDILLIATVLIICELLYRGVMGKWNK